QRYWIMSTPLEYLIVAVLGKAEFVEKESKNIISTLKMREADNQWQKVSPVHGGYSVQVPGAYNIIANDPFGSMMGSPEIIGYDPSDSSYYFVIEKAIKDISYLEETDFELKRIQYEFYKSLKIDSLNGKFTQNPPSFTSEAKLNEEKTIRLKSVVNGSHYYLFGTVGYEDKTKQFFDSFKIGEFNYYREPQIYRVSILNYTVKTQIQPAGSQIDFDYYYQNDNYNSKKNHFEGSNKPRTLT